MIDSATSVVLDTDVVSFLFDQDRVRAPRYEPLVDGRLGYLPFTVIGELLYRVEHRHWSPARRARLEEFLGQFVIVHSAPDIVQNWAVLRAVLRQRGQVIERQDAWVAAVAITLQLPLVTHNASDFDNVPTLVVWSVADQ